MPGQVLTRVSVPANSRVDIMTGTPHEFPDPMGNIVTAAAVTEGAAGSGLLTLSGGTRQILEDGNLLAVPVIGTNPIIPDNTVARGAIAPGERIRAFLINTTGAPVIMTGLVDLS
ncbi:MAG: hypothetical protein V3T08_10205 [Gemmatimonadota bacterium]